jgi:hypothetical protein
MAINTDTVVYGIPPSKIASFDAKSKSKVFFGFKFPMLKDSTYLSKSNGASLAKSNLIQLLQTSRGERLMLPKFGTNLKQYLMEPLDQALLSQIRSEILESMELYAPGINLDKLTIIPGNTTGNGAYHILIKLLCSLKDEDATNFEIKIEVA